MFSTTQRPKGAQTPSNCHISPKCWQNISNTNIYIQLTHVFPNPAPEGRTDTLQLPYIPELLAEYIQYKYIYSADTTSQCPCFRLVLQHNTIIL